MSMVNGLVIGAAIILVLVVWFCTRHITKLLNERQRRKRAYWNKHRHTELNSLELRERVHEARRRSHASWWKKVFKTKRMKAEVDEVDQELEQLLEEVLQAGREKAKKARLAELSRQEDLEREALDSVMKAMGSATRKAPTKSEPLSIEEEVRQRLNGTYKGDA
jgi:hypothetical protein